MYIEPYYRHDVPVIYIIRGSRKVQNKTSKLNTSVVSEFLGSQVDAQWDTLMHLHSYY